MSGTQQSSWFNDDDDRDDVYSNSALTEGTEGNSTVGTASVYGDDDNDDDDQFYNNISLGNWLTNLWSDDIPELCAGSSQPEKETRDKLTGIDAKDDDLGTFCIADLTKGRPNWKVPSKDNQLMVFWSEENGCSQGIGSPVLNTPNNNQSRMIQEKIKTALLNFKLESAGNILVQFWVPIKEGSRHFLTTSDQPFGIRFVEAGLCKYRIHSRTYEFNVEDDLGVPGRVFRYEWPEFTSDVRYYSSEDYPQGKYAEKCGVRRSLVLPVFEPSSGHFIGVLEFTDKEQNCYFKDLLAEAHLALEVAELKSPYMYYDICGVQISEAKQLAATEIHNILMVIGTTFKLPLAQVWVPFTHKKVGTRDLKSCESFDEEVVFALSSVNYDSGNLQMQDFRMSCTEHLMRKGQGVVGKAFLISKPCFCPDITKFSLVEYPLAHYACYNGLASCCAICFCSTSTGNCEYVLEFFLPPTDIGSGVPTTILNSLLAIMNGFPSFKVAFADETGKEPSLEVIQPTSKMESTTKNEEESNAAVTCVEETCVVKTPERKFNTAELPLTYEVLKQHFGKKLEVAAASLGVSRSTLKRMCREHGISRWPSYKRNKINRSPPNIRHAENFVRRVGKLSEESSKKDGSNYLPPSLITNVTDYVIVKAKHGADMIRFRLALTSGVEMLVMNVMKRLHLQVGSFRLKYEDDDGDLILITCDEDLQECMECSRSLGKTAMKILVHPISSCA